MYTEIVKEDERFLKLKEIEEILSRNPQGKLYVWGCSQTARMITDFCRRNKSPEVSAYIVDDVYYREETFLEKAVVKASEWRKGCCPGDCVIFGFTGSERAKELSQELPDGVKGVYFHFPYSANVDGTYLTYQDYQEHEERFAYTYECLADERSRAVMTAFINACISGNAEKLEELKSEGQYFNELTRDMKKGCFVDLGAYVGDTIEKAENFYGENLEKVVAFEPDRENLERLAERVKACGIVQEKLLLIQKGSWSRKEVLYFSSSNSSSSISDAGDIEIEVDSVDHVLQEDEFPVSFIKMDVEGSEKESLLGAAGTIQKWHPILAVCVYHKPEDLYSLPELIGKLAEKQIYRYYLRYYGPDLRELVLYAIPVE